METFLLWLITIQGFFVMFFEYDVWRMNRDRFFERKQWRVAKQQAKLKKAESVQMVSQEGENNGGSGIPSAN